MLMVTIKRALLMAAILAVTCAAGAEAGGPDAARPLPLVACICRTAGAAATHAGPLRRAEHCPRIIDRGGLWLMQQGIGGPPCRATTGARLRLVALPAFPW